MFGCDACQDVCPFNATEPLPLEATEPFAPHPRHQSHEAGDLLALDQAEFEAFAEGSPLKRPGRAGLARNAAIVLGNSGDKRHLPVLVEAARHHDSEVVRATAAWAVERLTREEPPLE
jgi:epoxyqueuosine reductase